MSSSLGGGDRADPSRVSQHMPSERSDRRVGQPATSSASRQMQNLILGDTVNPMNAEALIAVPDARFQTPASAGGEMSTRKVTINAPLNTGSNSVFRQTLRMLLSLRLKSFIFFLGGARLLLFFEYRGTGDQRLHQGFAVQRAELYD